MKGKCVGCNGKGGSGVPFLILDVFLVTRVDSHSEVPFGRPLPSADRCSVLHVIFCLFRYFLWLWSLLWRFPAHCPPSKLTYHILHSLRTLVKTGNHHPMSLLVTFSYEE